MAYVKIFHIHKHNKQKFYRLAEKALQNKEIKNLDLCTCTTCIHELHKQVQARKEINKNQVKRITISNISVLNNIYSVRSVSSHLNVNNTNYFDHTDREQTKAKSTRASDTVDNKEYVDYSSLLVLNVGINGYKCKFLADTGSEVDAISPKFLETWIVTIPAKSRTQT